MRHKGQQRRDDKPWLSHDEAKMEQIQGKRNGLTAKEEKEQLKTKKQKKRC